MANLGAEVSKIISAKKRNDNLLLGEYFKKANKILQDITALPDMEKRKFEMERLSEVIQDMINPRPVLTCSSENIISYFTPFAIRLMSQQ